MRVVQWQPVSTMQDCEKVILGSGGDTIKPCCKVSPQNGLSIANGEDTDGLIDCLTDCYFSHGQLLPRQDCELFPQ